MGRKVVITLPDGLVGEIESQAARCELTRKEWIVRAFR